MHRPKLDKSRNFSTVYPVERGAAFFQDGWYFTAEGEIVREFCTTEQLAMLAADSPAPEPVDGEDAPPAPSIGKKKGGRPAKAKAEPASYPPSEMDDGSDVNFEAWLRGQQECKANHVISAVRNRLEADVRNLGEARDYLVFVEQLVPEHEVKV